MKPLPEVVVKLLPSITCGLQFYYQLALCVHILKKKKKTYQLYPKRLAYCVKVPTNLKTIREPCLRYAEQFKVVHSILLQYSAI